MINGVVTAVVSEVKDPENLGRVQIQLSAHAGGAKEWARVVSPLIGRNLTIRFGIGMLRSPLPTLMQPPGQKLARLESGIPKDSRSMSTSRYLSRRSTLTFSAQISLIYITSAVTQDSLI
jgi:hypothetical protein